jgi:hypothetical protein
MKSNFSRKKRNFCVTSCFEKTGMIWWDLSVMWRLHIVLGNTYTRSSVDIYKFVNVNSVVSENKYADTQEKIIGL